MIAFAWSVVGKLDRSFGLIAGQVKERAVAI